MERVILRHRKGSKASQMEEFPLAQFSELILGRDPSADVRFDPERDDLVGRQHARIVRDPADRHRFTLVDLDSRNGTFLNRQRVTGTVALAPGDVVQLGAGGPEIEFDLDPRPAHLVKATRLGVAGTEATHAEPVAATRVGGGAGVGTAGAAGGIGGAGAAASGAAAGGATKPFYGKETVQRMIGETRRDSRRGILVGSAVLVLGVAGVTAWQVTQSRAEAQRAAGAVATRAEAMTAEARTQIDSVAQLASYAADRSRQWTPKEIADRYAATVVQIEFSWKLIFTPTGGQVYHRYVPNRVPGTEGQNARPLIDNGRQMIPAYVAVGQNELEPALTLDANGGPPIGVSSGGSGFVVEENGYIVTNRHVAANWRAPYVFDQREHIGVVLGQDGEPLLQQGQPVVVAPPARWVPDETKQAGPKGVMGNFQGNVEYLYASFPKNTLRIEASVARVSDRHDLALIKINTPQKLPTVELYDNYDRIGPGDEVTVLGYPAVSDAVIAVLKSKDSFNREAQQRVVPDPTLSVGYIGKVLRAADGPVNDAYYTFAPRGDTYQLTINSTGGGNSGGPMFDAFGRVVGVFFAGKTLDAQISFSVPIRYATELLSVTPNTP